jgi:hypothetical protein
VAKHNPDGTSGAHEGQGHAACYVSSLPDRCYNARVAQQNTSLCSFNLSWPSEGLTAGAHLGWGHAACRVSGLFGCVTLLACSRTQQVCVQILLRLLQASNVTKPNKSLMRHAACPQPSLCQLWPFVLVGPSASAAIKNRLLTIVSTLLAASQLQHVLFDRESLPC